MSRTRQSLLRDVQDGRWYMTRGGLLAGPMFPLNEESAFAFSGKVVSVLFGDILHGTNYVQHSWTKDGFFETRRGNHEMNLEIEIPDLGSWVPFSYRKPRSDDQGFLRSPADPEVVCLEEFSDDAEGAAAFSRIVLNWPSKAVILHRTSPPRRQPRFSSPWDMI